MQFMCLLLLFTVQVDLAIGLKCWDCESDMDWSKCKLLNTKTCTSPQTKCGKFYTKQGAVETFRRDCFTEDYCRQKPQCTSQFSTCEISCCDGDACNTASFTTGSLWLCMLSAMCVYLILHLQKH